MKKPRILLGDDNKALQDGVRRLLEPEFEVVGAERDGRSLLKAAEELQPDLIVTDISMPGLSGIEVARQLADSGSGAKVVFFSFSQDAFVVRSALATGALGYVLKYRALQDLVVAVQEVLKGNHYVSPDLRFDLGSK